MYREMYEEISDIAQYLDHCRCYTFKIRLFAENEIDFYEYLINLI